MVVFPCQPFSALGERGGLDKRRGRGRLVDASLAAIEHRRPRAFIFENVADFVRLDNGRARGYVMEFLEDLSAYNLH